MQYVDSFYSFYSTDLGKIVIASILLSAIMLPKFITALRNKKEVGKHALNIAVTELALVTLILLTHRMEIALLGVIVTKHIINKYIFEMTWHT